ncbi:MAG: response regulator transcription factor [bacterium]
MVRRRILLVDDDVELCELLADYLSPEGFELESVHDGAHGLERALSQDHGLVLLDVMLPGLSGFEVLRKLREQSRIPVLMLTARGDDVDRIVGLEMGADDYLAKPFNTREMVARIRAILRRVEGPSPDASASAPVVVDDVVLDRSTLRVSRAGEHIPLTSVEFSLLEVLLGTAGQVISREDLCLKVLGRELSPYDRSVDVHVSNLRRKLGKSSDDTERIRTVRGVGYQYARSSRPAEEDA